MQISHHNHTNTPADIKLPQTPVRCEADRTVAIMLEESRRKEMSCFDCALNHKVCILQARMVLQKIVMC